MALILRIFAHDMNRPLQEKTITAKMSFDNDSETQMLYAMQSEDLPPASESTESGDDTGNAKDPQDIDVEVLPPEQSSPPLRRSSFKASSHVNCVIIRSEGSVRNEMTYLIPNASVWHVKIF